nr:retrovirus-related Pol polyprotein from transposon TNT 1-94 [Tanacetum cinerariifolium]
MNYTSKMIKTYKEKICVLYVFVYSTYSCYKTLINELANDGVNLSKHEINVGFVNSLLEKWLTFSQGLRNANHTKTLGLADIYRSQADLKFQKDYKAEYKKIIAKPPLLEDEEEVSNKEEVTQVKNMMALANDELTVGKIHARNGEWVSITIRKRHIREPIWYLDSGCSRSMTSFKSYLHKYVEQLVIAPNEPDIPYTKDTEGPPDLINTEVTHEQNVQNDQMITQPTNIRSGNDTKILGSITESLVPHVTRCHISNQASPSSHLPWDRWSRDQDIELVNIIGDPGEGMLTKSIDVKLTAASTSERLLCSQWLCPQLRLNILLMLGVVQVLSENYSSIEQVNSIQQLLAYYLINGTEFDIGEIIYSDLVTKLLNKSRLKYVSYPKFISCALQVLLDSDYTKDEKYGALRFQKYSLRRTKDLSPKSHPLRPGTAKTTPRPKGSLGDKDSGGNIPSADMELIHHIVADLSGVGAKYQVDQTQSTRLRYQSLTENKGKPSHEGEMDTQPMVLSTYADVRAFLLFDDKTKKSEEDILGAGKEIDEEPQATSIAETHHQDQTDKLVEAFMSSLNKSSNTISDLDKGLNIITELLKEIKNAVKDDSIIKNKINESTKSFTKFFTNITNLQSSMNTLYAHALKQDEELAA